MMRLALLAVLFAASGVGLTLAPGPRLQPGLDAFPRIATPAGPASTKINAALTRADGRARAAAADCLLDTGKSGWNREARATFAGPEFLSLVAHDDWFCGGPYPDTSTVALTYDLATGAPVNWAKLLPASLAEQTAVDTVGDGSVVGLLATPAIQKLYGRLAAAAQPPDLRRDCAGAYNGAPTPVMAWLDAARGALMLETTAFPHAAKACATTVAVPLAELQTLGAAPRLIEALRTAHDRAAAARR
jgi:hypothetical protein